MKFSETDDDEIDELPTAKKIEQKSSTLSNSGNRTISSEEVSVQYIYIFFLFCCCCPPNNNQKKTNFGLKLRTVCYTNTKKGHNSTYLSGNYESPLT